MKAVYPVVLTRLDDGFMAYVPDFQANTQGESLADAIEMARDAIGLLGIDLEDEGKEIPAASSVTDVQHDVEDIVSLVDIDFTEYRRRNDNRSVRRNVSLPAWLNEAANEAGINVSSVLQAALKQQLAIE